MMPDHIIRKRQWVTSQINGSSVNFKIYYTRRTTMEFEKRAMVAAEDKYTFRQSQQISSQTGLFVPTWTRTAWVFSPVGLTGVKI